MILICSIIFLLVLVLLPFAILTRAGDEGFIKSSLDKSKNLTWAKHHIPIFCLAHPNIEPTHLAFYNKAIHEINREIDLKLLEPCTPWGIESSSFPKNPVPGYNLIRIGQAEIKPNEIIVESTLDPDPAGTTKLYESKKDPGYIYGATIHISKEHSNNYAVWLHEILHSLGLAHDRVKGSIMWPVIQERSGILSKKDIKHLKQTYTK